MVSPKNEIAGWMQRQVAAAGARGLVVGLSGGVDSAVVARLCQIAMPDAVLAMILPCLSNAADERDARLVVDHFGLPTVTVRLDAAYDELVAGLRAAFADGQSGAGTDPKPLEPERVTLAVANVKPRLRMTALYFAANELNYLVAGTGNRSEIAVGYFTKYGDGGVDLLPLGNLLKDEVRALARELGVPRAIVDKAPSAGLWPGQTDEAEMGFTYPELEAYLTGGPSAVAPPVALRIERSIRASAHKRRMPPVPTGGPGTNGYREA
jgi:NAD+ synthase